MTYIRKFTFSENFNIMNGLKNYIFLASHEPYVDSPRIQMNHNGNDVHKIIMIYTVL